MCCPCFGRVTMNNPGYHPLAAVFGNDEDGPVGAVQDLEGDVVARDDGAGTRPVDADDDEVVVPLAMMERERGPWTPMTMRS